MKKLNYLMVLMTLVPMLTFAQPYKFEQTLQITGDDYIYSTDIVTGTTDYISAGYTNMNSANSGSDILIFKWDDMGYGVNNIYRYTGPGNKTDCARKIIRTSNGTYLVVGNTFSFKSGNNEAFAMKLNSSLQVTAFKLFGNSYSDFAFSCCEDTYNFYICGRFGRSSGTQGFACSINKTTGVTNWAKTYTDQGGTSIAFYSVIVGYDNELYIAGVYGAHQMVCVGLNHLNGSVNFATLYTPSNGRRGAAWNITKGTNNGYLLTGYTYNGSDTDDSNDVYLIKIRGNSTVSWAKRYNGNTSTNGLNSRDNGLQSIMNSNGNSYAVYGYTHSFKTDDVLLMEIDTSGNQSWVRTYHNFGSNEGNYSYHNISDGLVHLGSDGFAITSGREVSTNIYDPYLIRTNSAGHSGCDSTRTLTRYTMSISTSAVTLELADFTLRDSTISAGDVSSSNNIICDTTDLSSLKKTKLRNNDEEVSNSNYAEYKLNLFPNPSNGLVHLSLINMKNDIASLFIYDFMGKLVYSDKADKYKFLDYSVDLSKYGKGIFFVKIIDGSKTHSNKFIIQ